MTKRKGRSIARGVVAGFALFLVTACGTSETARLYTLSPLSDSGGDLTASVLDGPAIGVGPVNMPQYLDRPQIIERAGPNRLIVAEFDRWAEPLNETVPRVLAENLAHLLESDRVYVMPRRRRLPLDLTLEVDFSQFEALVDGSAALGARWHLFADSDTPLGEGVARIRTESSTNDSYETRVKLLSDALAELSRRIAMSITALDK